jgi:hypothetical protein
MPLSVQENSFLSFDFHHCVGICSVCSATFQRDVVQRVSKSTCYFLLDDIIGHEVSFFGNARAAYE